MGLDKLCELDYDAAINWGGGNIQFMDRRLQSYRILDGDTIQVFS